MNQYGQSRKHIFDSIQLSLKRLQLDYVDVLQCSSLFKKSSLAAVMRGASTLYLTPSSSGQAIALITKLPYKKWCVLPPLSAVALGHTRVHYLRDCSSTIGRCKRFMTSSRRVGPATLA